MMSTDNKYFEEFVSDDNLQLAWKRMTHSVRYEVKDRLGLQAYASQINKHMQILQDSLRSEYEPSDAYPFYKVKQDRSLRRFSFLSMDDRFVYQAICNVLIKHSYEQISKLVTAKQLFSNVPTPLHNKAPYTFKRVFTDRSGVNEGQYDKYRKQVLQSRREFLKQGEDSWLIRTDIRSYFPSINHHILLQTLEDKGWLPDRCIRYILKHCLTRWARWESEDGKGIPIGYECSDQIGSLFLFPLDEALSDFTVHRYVDDIYIFVENFEQVKWAIHLVDKELEKLSLQRNTLKTEFLALCELGEEQLRRKLTESLSQLTHEKSSPDAEQERQKKLFQILQDKFDKRSEGLNLNEKIENISKVAFVLYRLKDRDRNIRMLAYHILDHYPNYALHAISYLYRTHRNDPELNIKLTRMIKAEYEANDVKAHALKYLNLIDEGQGSKELIEDLFNRHTIDNWYLLYEIIKDIINRNAPQSYSRLLVDVINSHNPFISSYAANALFTFVDKKHQNQLVNKLLLCESNYMRKIALYLAYRFRIRIDPSSIPTHLEILMDTSQLEEKDYFHKTIKDLFRVSLVRDFPIQKYFGCISKVNQMLRDVDLHRLQGIESFLKGLKCLLDTFLYRLEITTENIAVSEGVDFPNDNPELISLMNDLKPSPDGTYSWKNGQQNYLLNKFSNVFGKYLKEIQREIQNGEGFIVRREIFICYARSNEEWKNEVKKHLKPYENYSNITVWSDDKIKAGQDWDQEIKDALNRTKFAILLITPEFLASNYIYDQELPEIMRASQEDGLEIIWIPVSPSAVLNTPIGQLQAAFDPGRTLREMIDEDKQGEVDRKLSDVCSDVCRRMADG